MNSGAKKRPSDGLYFAFFLCAALGTLYFNQVLAVIVEHFRLVYPLLATSVSFFGYYLGIRAVRRHLPVGRVLQIVLTWNLIGVMITFLGSALVNWLLKGG